MSLLTLEEVLEATGGTLVRARARAFGGVTIDGRAVSAGDLFFAVRGEKFDGHDFAAQAVLAGAGGVVVERGRGGPADATVVEVEDSRIALGEVGRLLRRRWGGTLIGITGSAGKTTTKEMTAAALAGVVGRGAVLASEGSLNNETGVPLTLARLRPEHRFAVVEMGMRGLGQIDDLTRLAQPDVGVVVNAGAAHVGVVGSVEAIARGKSEIWGRLPRWGWAVRPHADERLAALVPAGVKLATFGEETGATVRLADFAPRGAAGSLATLEIGWQTLEVTVPLVGRHNASNAACVMAIAIALGVDVAAAARGLADARPAPLRGEIETIGGRHVLVDCYNANPASMKAALESLAGLAAGGPSVAVLGDMLELGDSEAGEHAELGKLVAANRIGALITVGERARAALPASGLTNVLATDDPAEAAAAAARWAGPDGWILVKASRGMRLERVVEALRKVA